MTGALQQLSASQLHVLEALDGATFVKTCEIGRCAKYDESELDAEVSACATSLLDRLWFILDTAGLRMRLESKAEFATKKDLYSADITYGIYVGAEPNSKKVAQMRVRVRANRINDVVKTVARVQVVIEQAVLNSASALQP